MCLTRSAMHLAFEATDTELDYIPLAEIVSVDSVSDDDMGMAFEEDVQTGQGAIHIATEADGHNSGREYYVRPSAKDFETFMSCLKRLSHEAKTRRDNHNIIQRAQKRVLTVYESTPVQALAVLMISSASVPIFNVMTLI
jgi:hypothetical protein